MCVIAVVEHVRLTDIQVEQMFDANKHGGGVAWRGISEDGANVVKWEKGLNKEEMLKMNRELPLPYVLHFRVPSNDTSISYLACHPFQIDQDATVGFEGETDGFVLFHNGFWAGWKEKLQQIALNGAVRIPSGPWSDSRALALAAHHLGLGFLEMVNEKVVAFGPNAVDIEVFGGWQVIKNPDDNGEEKTILVSNKSWERPVYTLPTRNIIDNRAGGTGTPSGPSFSGPYGRSAGSAGSQGNNQGPISEILEGDGERVVGSRLPGLESTTGALDNCYGCKKQTRSGQMFNDHYYCFQCWSQRTQQAKKKNYGLCHTCKVAHAATKKYADNQWICNMCWESNNRPRVYLMEVGR